MNVPKGRVAYEPNTLDPHGPRETPERSFVPYPEPVSGVKERLRPESFADHYSQARLFYRSIREPEQMHVRQALTFELGKVETVAIRERMLGHLQVIDRDLAKGVADGLGMNSSGPKATPARQPIDLAPSPALSLLGRMKPTLVGRDVAILLGDGFDAKLKQALMAALEKEGATATVIAPKAAGAKDAQGKIHAAKLALNAAPSVFFDAVTVLAGKEGDAMLAKDPDALGFLRDAHRHLKAIGLGGVDALRNVAGIKIEAGISNLSDKSVSTFISDARNGRVWGRQV